MKHKTIEDIKLNIIESYSKYIKKFFSENWDTLVSHRKLSNELFYKIFWDEEESFQRRTHQFERYIKLKQLELWNLEDKKLEDKKSLEQILERVKKNLSLLKKDWDKFDDIRQDLVEYKTIISNFNKKFNSSEEKLISLIDNISKYEITAKDELHQVLDSARIDIKKFFEWEHKKIIKFLKDKSKETIDKKFLEEKLKIDEHKIKLLHFDFYNFIKYLIIIWAAFSIIYIDFELVQKLLVDLNDLNEKKVIKRFKELWIYNLYMYILPLIPSVILIFGEYFNLKYFKRFKKLSILIHLLAFCSAMLIILSALFDFEQLIQALNAMWKEGSGTYEIYNKDSIEDIYFRALIFWVWVPTLIYGLYIKFNFNEFVQFLSEFFWWVYWILMFIPRFIYSNYRYYKDNRVLAKKRKYHIEETNQYFINTEQLEKLFKVKENEFVKLFSIPKTFNHDMLEFEDKLSIIIGRINDFEAYLTKDEVNSNNIWFFARLFRKSKCTFANVLDNKIERLKFSIAEIGVMIKEQEKEVNNKYQSAIDVIHDQINEVKENRKIFLDEYEHKKELQRNE